MRVRSLVAALLAFLLAAVPARADFQYEFASGGTFGTAFSVNQGSTIPIQVYLVQTGSSTNLTANGLTDAGVSLQFSSSAPFAISSSANISPNPAFVGPNNTTLTTSAGTTTATVQVHSPFAVFPGSTTDGSGNPAILLGTFTFSAPTPGTSAVFTALPNPSLENNVDGAGNNLDSLVHNTGATINVVAVPEPGTLILTGLFAAGLAGQVWRRRRLRASAM